MSGTPSTSYTQHSSRRPSPIRLPGHSSPTHSPSRPPSSPSPPATPLSPTSFADILSTAIAPAFAHTTPLSSPSSHTGKSGRSPSNTRLRGVGGAGGGVPMSGRGATLPPGVGVGMGAGTSAPSMSTSMGLGVGIGSPPTSPRGPMVRSQTEPVRKRTAGAARPGLSRRGTAKKEEKGKEKEEQSKVPPLVLEKYTLYETRTKLYVVASNQADSRYRVLKIDRTAPGPPPATNNNNTTNPSPTPPNPDSDDESEGLNVTEDTTIYTTDEINELIDTLRAGNAGGITRVEPLFYGIAGFIRFTSTYYMILIKQRESVGLIGGHYVYHCEETALRPVTMGKKANSAEEQRLMAIFAGVDLSKNFYFSYTYDLTRTLQQNLTSSPTPTTAPSLSSFNDKWVWNLHLLRPAFKGFKGKNDWVLPLIHGFVDQAKLSVFGRTVYITLIARRSRHFAGARFLKRGANNEGYVANDVETEQIVSEALTTPFHIPYSDHGRTGGPTRMKLNPRYTSFVQVRGSIPLFWSQESVNMSPKPPIELSIVDPYFAAAARHFDDLLGRYGGQVMVLNLIKQNEKQPRESKLLPEFKECIDYLNQFLPANKQIKYIPWDMAAANKQRDKDVIGILEDIAEEALELTSFFHTGPEPAWYAFNGDPEFPAYRDTALLQFGVTRTNCIDCLDRTNAAQFVIAKAALGHQLHALGIIHHPRLPFDSDAVNLITEMFHDHGHTIALQYGGSHLVNTMETYRKIGQWTSHSRTMIENLKRYYANSFADADKQAAIDLFLGMEPTTTTLQSFAPISNPRSYRDWFTPSHLEEPLDSEEALRRLSAAAEASTTYWQSYYRPRLFTEFSRHFGFKVNSTVKYDHLGAVAEAKDHSPFLPRLPNQPHTPLLNVTGVRRWMSHRGRSKIVSGKRVQSQHVADPSPAPPISNTTESIIHRLLHPTVSTDETTEYEAYVDQFAHLSLSQDLSEKDLGLYKSSAEISGGKDLGLVVERSSMGVYSEAVRMARPGQELRGSEWGKASANAQVQNQGEQGGEEK